MIRFFYLITTVVLVLTSVAYATAQNATESFKKGKYFFDNGKYQEAYDYFFKAFQEAPGNPNINFYLGRAAFEKGDYEAAVMAFDDEAQRYMPGGEEPIQKKLEKRG